MKNLKILPLRSLSLSSKPLNHKAIVWSCDSELAIGADDSIFIFLPEFPILDPNAEDQDDESELEGVSSQAGFLSSRLPKQYGDGSGDEDDDDRLEEDSEDDDDFDIRPSRAAAAADDTHLAATRANADPHDTSDPRQQFLDGMRHLPVSYPYLSPDLNAHVWEAGGRDMPLIDTNLRGHPDRDLTHTLDAMPLDGNHKDGYTDNNGPPNTPFHEATKHHPDAGLGAGLGLIGSAGTSLNHVVALGWSPSGLGRNRRPVLAVLTGCGTLAVYGEGSALPFGSMARPLRSLATRGKGAVRNLASWMVLWAVGEKFVVPGQEAYGYGEFVQAFAWSHEIGAGKALLAYMNDMRELVILRVATKYRRTKESRVEEAVWHVHEVCRREAEAPHGAAQDLNDPDFVPGRSSYCVRWSPWLKEAETWTCVLSYLDKNYVGFRRISIDSLAWTWTDDFVVNQEPNDWDGRCVHLGVDAFLEFEKMIWTVGDRKICRGYLATPLVAEPFEVDLTHSNADRPKAGHSTDQCNTSIPRHDAITNPITGLIIHPVSLHPVSPPLLPFYTAVRLSATATNAAWWESNYFRRGKDGEEPQWATDIQQQITAVVPRGLAGRVGIFGDDAEHGEDGVEEDDETIGIEDGPPTTGEVDESDGHGHVSADGASQDDCDGPDVHPYRMRIWGLATSPGGGTSAVLATPQLTQKPERGGWHSYQSRVIFDHKTNNGHHHHRRPRRNDAPEEGGEKKKRRRHALAGAGEYNNANNNNNNNKKEMTHDEESRSTANVENLTTEARLWEWMYGGGPGVPGITHYADTTEAASGGGGGDDGYGIKAHGLQEAKDAEAQTRRDTIKGIFQSFVEQQDCPICDDGRTRFIAGGGSDGGARAMGLDCVCQNGHRVAACGASGLAITEPGISRCCGVCRSRCLALDVMVEDVLLAAGKTQDAQVVKRHVNNDVCARCGGKYLD